MCCRVPHLAPVGNERATCVLAGILCKKPAIFAYKKPANFAYQKPVNFTDKELANSENKRLANFADKYTQVSAQALPVYPTFLPVHLLCLLSVFPCFVCSFVPACRVGD